VLLTPPKDVRCRSRESPEDQDGHEQLEGDGSSAGFAKAAPQFPIAGKGAVHQLLFFMTKKQISYKKRDQKAPSEGGRSNHTRLTNRGNRPRGRPRGVNPPLTARERKERYNQRQREIKSAADAADLAANGLDLTESEESAGSQGSLPTALWLALTPQQKRLRKTLTRIGVGAPGRYANRPATVQEVELYGEAAFEYKNQPFDRRAYDQFLVQECLDRAREYLCSYKPKRSYGLLSAPNSPCRMSSSPDSSEQGRRAWKWAAN
jgi:hypothetical protein